MHKMLVFYKKLAIALLVVIAFITCMAPMNDQASAQSANEDPVVIRPASMLVTHDVAPRVLVQAAEGLLITLYKGDQAVGTGLGNGAEPVEIQLAPLGRGVHNLTATTSLLTGQPLGTASLPKIVIDDAEPFDISDIVKFAPELYSDDSPGFSFNTVFTGLMETVSPKEALASQISYEVEPGTVEGTTRLLVPSSSLLHIKVSSTPLPVPGMGSLVPSGSMRYVPGSNISDVDAEHFKYIGLYESDVTGVTGFALITLRPEDISEVTMADKVTSVNLQRASIGQFAVGIEPNRPELAKGDFAVHLRSSGASVNISNFTYDAANGTITLGPSVVEAYNRVPIELTVAASSSTTQIVGSSTVSVLIGSIQGVVRDSVTEEAVEGIVLNFREDLGNQAGEVVATAVTSADGTYSVPLDPGLYMIELSRSGYITGFLSRTLVLSDGTASVNDFVVVPEPTVPAASEIVSLHLLRPSIGEFQIDLEHAVSGVAKDDFTVTIDTYGGPVDIEDFTYDAENGTITLGPSVVEAYNRVPMGLTVAAAPASTQIVGSATLQTIVGQIQGTVRHEITEAAAGGILLKFREGYNNQTGEVVATAVTSADGTYAVSLDPGSYTVELSGEGYVTRFANRTIVFSESFEAANEFVVVNIPAGDDIRIVLTWEAEPTDLDSHLIGPTPDGGSFHIYFGETDYVRNNLVYASLDMDDVDGYGPETTTLATVVDSVYGPELGIYTFYVHQWSESNISLSQSNAKVEVYKGNSVDPLYTYHVPTTGIGERYWTVFNIMLSESGITFEEIGTMALSEPWVEVPVEDPPLLDPPLLESPVIQTFSLPLETTKP